MDRSFRSVGEEKAVGEIWVKLVSMDPFMLQIGDKRVAVSDGQTLLIDGFPTQVEFFPKPRVPKKKRDTPPKKKPKPHVYNEITLRVPRQRSQPRAHQQVA